MNRKFIASAAGWLLIAIAVAAGAQAVPAQDGPKLGYTLPEYNMWKACDRGTMPDAKLRAKCLDEFVAKYPASTLLPYAYKDYYVAYSELRDAKRVVEYCDKQLALGPEKVDANGRLEAAYVGTVNFYQAYTAKAADKDAQLKAVLERARTGLDSVPNAKKPENVTEEQFATYLKQSKGVFNYAIGFASMEAKDYKMAISGFKAALEINPTDASAYFRIGVSSLQMAPPSYMDGFWMLAKAITLKGPGEAQYRTYLKNQLNRFQQPPCDSSIDQEMNELIALAGSSADRPATYSIPSAADLEQARAAGTNFVADLKAGGDKAKLLWLSLCHAEYPELGAKVFEVGGEGDTVVVKAYVGTTQEEIEGATAPNSEIKIEGQPEAKRLEKDGLFKFTGTLASYDPEPYLLRWEKGKVDPEFIPAEPAPPAKSPKAKGTGKRPAKKPPSR